MSELRIVEFQSENAHFFKSINSEWITEMFALEAKDEKVLNHPEELIIKSGGVILFVADSVKGIVGTVALLKTGADQYELTKMGVSRNARGLNAGSFLLKAIIQKAKDIGANYLYLLTNSKCEAAIHLYEKNGFKHDAKTLELFGPEYMRANVAMRYYG